MGDFAIAEQQRRLMNMIRVGTVSEVDAEECRARVKIGEDTETPFLKWLAPAAGTGESEWRAPSIESRVIVLSPNGDLSVGYILPGIFNTDNQPPSNDPSVSMVKYGNGDYRKHSDAGFELKSANTQINGNAVTSGNMTIEGNLTINGQAVSLTQILATIDVIAAGISLVNHKHDPQTGRPIPG